MMQLPTIFCFDSNVLIEAWNKYYSPSFCENYWEVLNEMGRKGLVFIPEAVYAEVVSIDDDLAKWLKETRIHVREVDEQVTKCLRDIYAADPRHERLVDSTNGRSLADPWVIAHAMAENAVVVTKEELVTYPSSQRIKIPNVCQAMGLRWMNDFEFIRQSNIRFTCSLS